MILLTPPMGNTKTRKNKIPTYIMHLASGAKDICPDASPGCKATCLVYAGRAIGLSVVMNARRARLAWFRRDRAGFLAALRGEMERAIHRHKGRLAFRLNGTSDLPIERLGLPQAYPSMLFYDYTKSVRRYSQFLRGQNWPRNYHLTFSRSEQNEKQCLRFLDKGGTCSIVFAGKEFPATYKGFPVVSGETTDYRPDDKPGHWIALKIKGTNKRKALALQKGFSLDT